MTLTKIRSMQSEVADLTKRQLEILVLVSKGCSNIDISELLHISPNTVKAHLATVLERLHVSNRTEASVLYEKHLHHENSSPLSKLDFMPIIEIGLIYKGLSRTEEIAENLSNLLHCFEIISVHAQASQNLLKDSKSLEHNYVIKIDDLTDIDADIQISLFVNDKHEESQKLLYKTNHPLAIFDPQCLIKYAQDIYQNILKFETENVDNKNSVHQMLCKILLCCEAVSLEQLKHAIQLCDQLLENHKNWHLLYAVKSFVCNKLMTNGHSVDVAKDSNDLAYNARKALSLKPSSAWSQLAFAYYCAFSSDLNLARKHLLASIDANPCQYRALQLLGQVHAFENRIEDSISVFNQLLVNFPNSESKGVCYGALALVYYCAEDYSSCKKSAKRALMYEDAPQIPMIITLISVADIEHDELALVELKQQLELVNINEAHILQSLSVAEKIIPPERLDKYISSLKRTGVIQ